MKQAEKQEQKLKGQVLAQLIQPRTGLQYAAEKALLAYRQQFGEVAEVLVLPRVEGATDFPDRLGSVRVLVDPQSPQGFVYVCREEDLRQALDIRINLAGWKLEEDQAHGK